MAELYEWLFELSDIEVDNQIEFVLCNADREILRYTLTVKELLGLLEHSSETRDSIASLILSYRAMNLDVDDVLSSEYLEFGP